MPAIPGTFDGQRIKDKRTFYMSDTLQAYYQQEGVWDAITDVRGTEGQHGETITVRLGERKDTWRYRRTTGRAWRWFGYLNGDTSPTVQR